MAMLDLIVKKNWCSISHLVLFIMFTLNTCGSVGGIPRHELFRTFMRNHSRLVRNFRWSWSYRPVRIIFVFYLFIDASRCFSAPVVYNETAPIRMHERFILILNLFLGRYFYFIFIFVRVRLVFLYIFQ